MGLAGFVNIFVPVAVIAAAVVAYIWRGWAEGTALESEMRRLSGNEYSVITHPVLRDGGAEVSVDYAVISIYGVFLVVTSDFKGRVTGSEDADTWTHGGRRGTETVENPLRRTAAFADVLQRQVLPAYHYPEPVAIVAYPARDVLAVQSTQHVTYLARTIDIIRSYDEVILSFSQAAGMTSALRVADQSGQLGASATLV